MALFSLNLMRIALELAKEDSSFEGMATKFFQHFVYIAYATHKRDEKSYELWSPEEGFFYDVLVYPDGNFSKFRVRSLVGIIPLFAIELLSEEELEQFPTFKRDFFWFLRNRKHLTDECVFPVIKEQKKYFLCSLVTEEKLKSLLTYLWDPSEFRSNFGIRSLSKFHETNPFYYKKDHIGYEPGESTQRMKGGNSNWRGPIWLPMNYLVLWALKKYAFAYDGDFKVQVKDEPAKNINEIIRSFSERLIALFTRDEQKRRPFLGPNFPFQDDPHFKDLYLFHEYFHAETGEGLGASHQTGWTALVANLIDELF
jgi:glycogen debranching enzyme